MDEADSNQEILLTKPFMPPLEEFNSYLERIWESRQLTNGGSIHDELEEALCKYLGVKYISLFTNGTLALIAALKVLDLKGEVITTPFTWIATSQAIYWNNLKPVFVDISEDDLNIDVTKIENAISPNTSAILPVHVFGNPCDMVSIDKLARKYNLKIAYDAAQAFGVGTNQSSICNFGDLSILSFHATKVFNCIEGGAVICHDELTKYRIDAIKNNGLAKDGSLIDYGLNARMNEFQASFGLIQLKYINKVIALRKTAFLAYCKLLNNVRGIRIIHPMDNITSNYSYLPIIINKDQFGITRDELFLYLKNRNISTRKYFYPLISDYPEFSAFKSKNLFVAKKMADNVLCLPLYHDISMNEIKKVTEIIEQLQNSHP